MTNNSKSLVVLILFLAFILACCNFLLVVGKAHGAEKKLPPITVYFRSEDGGWKPYTYDGGGEIP